MGGITSDPSVVLEEEDGKVVSAYVELRPGVKSAGMIQPNPGALVFFLVGEDGIPVGIRLFEPVSGVAACEIVETLGEGPAGPSGVDRQARHHFFLKPADLRHFMRGFRQGLKEFSAAVS